MDARVIVQVFSNLEDKDILMKDAIDLGEKMARAYERIDNEAKEQKKLVVGPLNHSMIIGERQHIFVGVLCYRFVDQPIIGPNLALPGRA